MTVNKHGVFHAAPDELLPTITRQGGRAATAAEQKEFEAGATHVGGKIPAALPPAPPANAPFADYDGLTVEQIVARAANLSPDLKTQALAYELANKKRKGVLEALTGE
ncbi:MAG: hypothetical protein WAU10_14875 [Caldilineaceae bacterium]